MDRETITSYQEEGARINKQSLKSFDKEVQRLIKSTKSSLKEEHSRNHWNQLHGKLSFAASCLRAMYKHERKVISEVIRLHQEVTRRLSYF